MARTRMLKPDLRTSEKVASWPVEVRYFWVLLWGYLDDYGKGRDNPLLVKADCFPLDPEFTPDLIDEWLWLLADSEVIVRYEVSGVRYLAAVNWSEHQKPQHPTASKCPDPSANAILTRDSGNAHEGFTPGFSSVQLGIRGGQRASGAARPPLFCFKHPTGSNGEKCQGCADARRLREEWEADERNKPTPSHTKAVKRGDGHACVDDGNGYCDKCYERMPEEAYT